MRPSILLAALLCFWQSSWAQNPPSPSNPPSPNSPPTRRSQETARLVGKIFPGYGATRLPSLMTITLVSITSGYMKVSMVQGASFEFSHVPPGRYRVRLESVGYEMAEKEIDVQPLGTGSTEFVSMILGPPEKDADDIQPGEGVATVTASSLGVPPKALKEWEKSVEESAHGNPQKAIDHLLKALKIHPEFAEAYNNLAVQYSKLGRDKEAIEAVEKSVQLQPSARAYWNLGIFHFQQRRNQEAIAALVRSNQLDGKNVAPVRALAEIYYGIGQYILALKRFWEWNQLSPDPEAVLGMSHCYRRLGFEEEAKRELRDYLASNPEPERAQKIRQVLAELEKTTRRP